ncbi:PfkB family carbohydrate kinase [Gordonia sp. DT219]|uniref:PfkB family carbohydrate kinase n=1 Tax=Gordonia sp. DT219 TaxID=3416658 RepID=UPI003CF48ADC
MSVVVIGQIGRDLVIRTDGLPEPGGTAPIVQWHEALGGKGANQAVGLAQLGVEVSLIGVAGTDRYGDDAVAQAVRDVIDVTGVVRRGRTALLVDLVDEPASRRLFEDVPAEALCGVPDIEQSAALIARADTVSLQLQQPGQTVLAAARRGRVAGARVVADGAVQPDLRADLLPLLDVLRADAEEAALIADDAAPTTQSAARGLARKLLAEGPSLVALAIPDVGDLLVWRDGSELYPHADVPVQDTTGAGDAFVAGLNAALRTGADPRRAGQVASAAAASTTQHLGGRPTLEAVRRHHLANR